MSDFCADLKARAIAAANQASADRAAEQDASYHREFEETFVVVSAKLPLLTKDDATMTYELCGHRFEPNGGGTLRGLRPIRRWYGYPVGYGLNWGYLSFSSAYIVVDEASFGYFLQAVEGDDQRRAAAEIAHQAWLNRPRGFWSRLFS